MQIVDEFFGRFVTKHSPFTLSHHTSKNLLRAQVFITAYQLQLPHWVQTFLDCFLL